MRYYAKRRGYSLSDKELVYEQKIRRFPSKHEIGEKIHCSTEVEIFEALGLPYKTPNERNVFDIDHLFSDQEKAAEFKLIRDKNEDDYNTSDSESSVR
jgi:DNA polymerase/3'-5' exonuclease PolX